MTSQEEAYEATLEKTNLAVTEYKEYLKDYTGKQVDILPNVQFADSDYLVYIDKILSHFLEVKCRNHKFGTYNKTKVPLRKHSTAEHYFNDNEIKTYFLCIFEDKKCILNLCEEPDSVDNQIARYDRGSDKDIYAFYDVSRFKDITKELDNY